MTTIDPGQTDAYWTGRLSAALEIALQDGCDEIGRSISRATLDEFNHWVALPDLPEAAITLSVLAPTASAGA